MAEKPSMVDKVPSQLDEQELKEQMDVEIPEAIEVEETPENVEGGHFFILNRSKRTKIKSPSNSRQIYLFVHHVFEPYIT